MESCKKRVVIYGVGLNCDIFLSYLHDKDFEVVAYVDKNKAGQTYRNFCILEPKEIREIAYDEIFVLMRVKEERKAVIKYLTKELQVDENKIKDVFYLNKKYMLSGISNYKYVFFTEGREFFNLPYSDIMNRNDTTIRSVLWIGQKWGIVEDQKEENNTGCFIFRSHLYLKYKSEGFYEYVQYCYPNVKRILLFSDLFEACKKRVDLFSLAYIKSFFDLTITYHTKEAEKYGFQYFPYSYSKLPLIEETESIDLFFVGRAKDRLERIHSLYLRARQHGLSCSFWIHEVEPDEMLKESEGIVYNQYLPYSEYLKKMMKCKCIVDVCQQGDETTMRYAEAVVYNKKLLIDDMECYKREYFNEKYMQRFIDVEEINFDWIHGEENVDYAYRGEFSPNYLWKFIDSYFNKSSIR